MPHVKQEKERSIIQQQIIQRIESLGFDVTPQPKWGEMYFLLNDKIGIALDYTHLNYRREFVFKFSKDKYEFFYNNHRHMLVEHRILLERGKAVRQQIIAIKRQGMKTEPAFCLLLGLKNDPYWALLDFEGWNSSVLISPF